MDTAMIIDSCVNEIMSAPGYMDEVALCFATAEELETFVATATTELGLEHFNSVERDTMVRLDNSGQFDVRFEFLRMPNRKWRFEAMCILDGEAPLHSSALAVHRSPVTIHLSYKCRDLGGYQAEVRQLMDQGARQLAEYRNSYGMFSYWSPARQGGRGIPYLKPRVNLRDV